MADGMAASVADGVAHGYCGTCGCWSGPWLEVGPVAGSGTSVLSMALVAAVAPVAGVAQGNASPAFRLCFSHPDLSRDLSALLSEVPFPTVHPLPGWWQNRSL